ncbi:MAG: TonB-dependent receptor [Candidatus Marinimicrobia bacterium]|nr:TonB-dependent receptor [Candidatus Neomarinimicrobiota bacterium]
MKKLSILFIVTLTTARLFSQNLTGKISGTVTSDGQPLVGANITLEGISSGAATDESGTYYVFDVQPGIYTLRVNYIGYKSQIISNVRVTIGLTTVQDFELEVAEVEGETVELTAEKPLIEIRQTNVARTIDSEAIDNYALRNVTSMVASQAGVIKMHDGMHIRGSRSEEIGYTLEGASMSGAGGKVVSNAIPEALEAIAVQVGGFDASIGKANAGMVQQSLKTGGSRLSGSILTEGMQSGDPWAATGDKDMTITLQGPIGNNIRFFGALRKISSDNYSSTSRWFTPFTIGDGNPIADKIGGLTPSGDMVVLDHNNGNYVFKDVDGDSVYNAGVDDLRGSNKGYAFENLLDDLSFNGSLQWDMNPIILRLTGTYNSYTNSGAGKPISNMFNTRRHESAGQSHLINLKATYFLNTSTYVRANVRTMGRKYEIYDKAFKDAGAFKTGHTSKLEDWLDWGNRDAVNEINSNWANHFGAPGKDSFTDPAGWDGAVGGAYKYVEPSNYNINGFRFSRDGARMGGYSKGEDGYIGFDAEFVSQMGEHEVKIGGDYTKYNYRRYNYWGINPLNSKIGQDPTLEAEVTSESDRILNEIVTARLSTWIGYDPLGRDWNASSAQANEYDKPREPWNMSFYVNDKFEAGDLIVNVGLRYEAINQANKDLKDYNNPPLDKNATIVGAEHPDYGFKDMITQSYFLPRIGLGFPISDRSTFHLNYGKYVQMAPMNQLYRSRGSGRSSWGLKPVRETKFEIGYGTLIGDVASIDVTLFSRNPQDQIGEDEYTPDSSPGMNYFQMGNHGIWVNSDFSNVTGIEVDFKTARVNNFQLFANYVFQDSRGLNSYPGLGTSGWGKPTTIAPTRYDQRHQASANLDFRTGRTGNVLTDNLGANLIASFNSGHPYTLSDGSMGQRDAGEGALLSDNDPRNRAPREPINSSVTPSYFNLDLSVEKMFKVGPTNIKAYVTIENVLNTQHIINVYNRTGDPYDDGFLSDPALSSLIIQGRGPEYVEMYRKINLANRNHWLNDHEFDMFGIPREIKTGIQVSF